MSSYSVNCGHCNSSVDAINPRCNEEPEKVWSADFGITMSDNIEVIHTHCPECRQTVFIKFQYPSQTCRRPAGKPNFIKFFGL